MSPLNRRILRLAVPNVLAAVSVPLVSVADAAMVGHLPRVAYLGAVVSAGAIFDVVFWGLGFLRMGTTALVAQYFGAGDRRACAQTLYRSLLLALLLGLVVLLARDWIAHTGLGLAGGSPEVQEWGRRYFAVRAYGVPLALITLALNGFFLGTANALAPMCVITVANVVNVGADYALIFGKLGAPELGVVGAAWAAVLANLVAAVTGGLILVKRYGAYLREPVARLFARRPLALIFRTNLSLFGRTLCLLFAQFFMLAMVSRMGEVPLAANAVIWPIWALVAYGVDGFAFAAETLVGNCLGARDFVGARQVARRIILWGIGIGSLFGVVYAVGLGPIARAFTDHEQVVEVTVSLTFLIAVVQPLNAVVFVFDGILIGANDMSYLFRAMLGASFLVYLPAALVLVYGLEWGIHGAWLAYNGLMLARFFTLLPRYVGGAWLRTFIPK